MSRSSKKGPYVSARLLSKASVENAGNQQTPIRVWQRASQIHPNFVGKWWEIHNGKDFIKLFVREDMVGHRFGEFAGTRNFRGHGQVVKRVLTKT